MPAHTVDDDDGEMLSADTPAAQRGAGGGGDAGGPARVSDSPEDDIEIQLEELQSQDEGGGGGAGPADAARDSGCVLHALCPLKPDSQRLHSEFAKLPQTLAILAVESAESKQQYLAGDHSRACQACKPWRRAPVLLRRHQRGHCRGRFISTLKSSTAQGNGHSVRCRAAAEAQHGTARWRWTTKGRRRSTVEDSDSDPEGAESPPQNPTAPEAGPVRLPSSACAALRCLPYSF